MHGTGVLLNGVQFQQERWRSLTVMHDISLFGMSSCVTPFAGGSRSKVTAYELRSDGMKVIRQFLGILLGLCFVSVSSAQERKEANTAAVPPNVLVFVHQEIQPGKTSERQKRETTIARACDRLDAPSFWIDLESLTGSRESLSFDLFDSFEHIQQAHSGWKQFYAAHPDLARTKEEMDSLVVNERTIVAVRRDDLGYLAENIDLSEARYMLVLEVRLFPGHEGDFIESLKLWSQARTKINAEVPSVVYQATEGTSSPTFLIFLPMTELKENEDFLAQRANALEAAEGEGTAERLRQIAREAFASAESNLYAVNAELSHVPKEFAAGNPEFWQPGPGPEAKPEAKPSVSPAKKKSNVKPAPQKGI